MHADEGVRVKHVAHTACRTCVHACQLVRYKSDIPFVAATSAVVCQVG